MTLETLNGMDQASFTQTVGWIFENSPWVAERAWARRPFANLHELHCQMVAQVENADRQEQTELLRAHPDLGTRAKLSDASATEQSGAGLDQLTGDEFQQFTALNKSYKRKFGFPFLFAVKGSGKQDILEALTRRLQSTPEAEFAEAMRQVYRIAESRLNEYLNQES